MLLYLQNSNKHDWSKYWNEKYRAICRYFKINSIRWIERLELSSIYDKCLCFSWAKKPTQFHCLIEYSQVEAILEYARIDIHGGHD